MVTLRGGDGGLRDGSLDERALGAKGLRNGGLQVAIESNRGEPGRGHQPSPTHPLHASIAVNGFRLFMVALRFHIF